MRREGAITIGKRGKIYPILDLLSVLDKHGDSETNGTGSSRIISARRNGRNDSAEQTERRPPRNKTQRSAGRPCYQQFHFRLIHNQNPFLSVSRSLSLSLVDDRSTDHGIALKQGKEKDFPCLEKDPPIIIILSLSFRFRCVSPCCSHSHRTRLLHP